MSTSKELHLWFYTFLVVYIEVPKTHLCKKKNNLINVLFQEHTKKHLILCCMGLLQSRGILLEISRSVVEFRKVLNLPMGLTSNRIQSAWSKPGRDTVKINVDAACNIEISSIATVARDWRGEVVFACSKRVNTTLHFQAEAKAIIQALNLVANLDVDSIFIESDSKSCINALRFPNRDVPWRIRTICSDGLALKLNFSICRFSWVAREANVAAHVLVKWSLSNNYFGSFDVGLAPPCFVSIIRAEALSLPIQFCFFLNKISGSSKKKKNLIHYLVNFIKVFLGSFMFCSHYKYLILVSKMFRL